MYVTIVIYADDDRYSALMISGEHKKKIQKRTNKNSQIETLLIGLIDCIKKIKYPVEIEIINNNLKLKEIIEQDLNYLEKKDYIINNEKLLKELDQLLKEHLFYNFTETKEKQKHYKIFINLFRDCHYKRF